MTKRDDGLLTATELDEELQLYDDLAEEFGLDREKAFVEIRSALERLREFESVAPPPYVPAVPVPYAVAADFLELLESIEGLIAGKPLAGALADATKKCRAHLDNGVLPSGNRCRCRAPLHAHTGGVCNTAGADWYKELGWPDSLMLCKVCQKHPADEEVERLQVTAARGESLAEQNVRQRKELRRFNHEAKIRASVKLESPVRSTRDNPVARIDRIKFLVKSMSHQERAFFRGLLE